MNRLGTIQRAALCVALAGSVCVTPVLATTSEAATAHVHGRIVSVTGDTLSLRLRDGRVEKVDIAAARAAHHTGLLPVGGAVIVYGTRDSAGVFHAISVGHASPDPKQWTPDD
jgi:hypothetical protein